MKVNFLYALFIIFCLIILIGLIGTSIYCFVVYGDKHVSEIPAWALVFMFGQK